MHMEKARNYVHWNIYTIFKLQDMFQCKQSWLLYYKWVEQWLDKWLEQVGQWSLGFLLAGELQDLSIQGNKVEIDIQCKFFKTIFIFVFYCIQPQRGLTIHLTKTGTDDLFVSKLKIKTTQGDFTCENISLKNNRKSASKTCFTNELRWWDEDEGEMIWLCCANIRVSFYVILYLYRVREVWLQT